MRRALSGLPVLALLGSHIGLFTWVAWRGLDLTDESYYLLNFQHWRQLTSTVTFFGAYFDLPFHLLGGDVGAMRVFGMALLVAGAGYFSWRALKFGRHETEPAPWACLFAGTTGAFFYYSFATTLRVPSYNLLVLFCMLAATGLVLTLAEGRLSRVQSGCAAFTYGLLIGACALTKAPSALATGLCHAVFLWRFGREGRLPEWVLLGLVGVGVNVLGLQLAQPQWFDALLEGVRLATALDGGRYASIPWMALWGAVLRGAMRLMPALLLAALVFTLVVRRWGRARRSVMSLLVLLLVAGIMLTIQMQGYGKSWWVLLVFGTALLWLAERLCRDDPLPRWRDVRGVAGLSALLFALPVCYSIGTNGSMPAHTQMATVFALVAMMLALQRLHSLGLIHRAAMTGALMLMGLPMLLAQLRSLDDAGQTYRLRTGLLGQNVPSLLGPERRALRLDDTTHNSLAALAKHMAAAGYRAGAPILDATGDGPGLVYALGARPLGVAWVIGGYPGSELVVARVLGRVPLADLRRAWVLTADDNPRSLKGLPQRVRDRVGEPGPQPAGSVRLVAQYRWDGTQPEAVTVTLWKPSASAPENPARLPR